MDWVEHWRAVVRRRTEQSARLRAAGGPDQWGRRAETFARGIDAADPFLDLVLARVQPDETVLDVGAGAGRFSIPLARRAAHVTAVDPSPGMLARLCDEAARHGLSNITTVESTWETAAVPAADTVVCAHVVYFIDEIVPFLRRLDAHARRRCLICLRVDQRDTAFEGLFREVWGEERVPEPVLIDLYNVLYAIGIVAHVAVLPTEDDLQPAYPRADLMTSIRRTLLDPPAAADAAIDRFIAERAETLADGRLRIPGHRGRLAGVWWEQTE